MMENRVRCIDGLKGLGACVIAFCVHYQVICKGYFPLGRIFPYLSYRGQFFVEMFFMLSGFGICSSYTKRIAQHNITFYNYIVRRLSKFYILHFISTLLCAGFEFGYMLKTGESIFYQIEDFGNLILNFLLLQSGLVGHVESFNAAAWFLSNVFICYIVFFFLLYYLKKDIKAFYAWGIIATIAIIVLYNSWTVPVFNRFVARGLLSFYIGMLICKIYYMERARRLKTVIGIISMLIVIITYIIFKVSGGSTSFVGNYQIVYSLAVMPALFLSVLFVKPINAILSSKPVSMIGYISAELFLLHYPVMYGIKAIDVYLGMNLDYYSYLTYTVYVILCFVVSYAAYRIGKIIRNNKTVIMQRILD